jgi:hypothetical protein
MFLCRLAIAADNAAMIDHPVAAQKHNRRWIQDHAGNYGLRS